MRFLVTAGSTREKIDDVRQWGNIFTGNTGYAIAKSLAALGEVDLLTSNRVHIAELAAAQPAVHAIYATPFTTHADLRELLAAKVVAGGYDAIFMSAAVSDYMPVRTFAICSRETTPDGAERWIVKDVQAAKVKSSYGTIAVVGEATEKLVDLFRAKWNFRGVLVKFKLEVGITPEALIEIGQKSRLASGADYLVANTLAMVDGPNAGAYLLGDGSAEWVARGQIAARMARLMHRDLP